MTAVHARHAFPSTTLQRIDRAIANSEALHGGELRFVVERALEGAALWRAQSSRERAIDLFSSLRIWDTEHNSGVLIYVLLADRSVEILADRGIHAKAGQPAWDAICRAMELYFRVGKFETGSLDGIAAITKLLEKHFPRMPGAQNELPDFPADRKSTRLNSSHVSESRMPSSA